MRTQNPSHAVRKNNRPILYKNACIVGLFTSSVSWPCCCQSSGDKAPALSLFLGAGQGDLFHLLLLPGGQKQCTPPTPISNTEGRSCEINRRHPGFPLNPALLQRSNISMAHGDLQAKSLLSMQGSQAWLIQLCTSVRRFKVQCLSLEGRLQNYTLLHVTPVMTNTLLEHLYQIDDKEGVLESPKSNK